MLDPKRVKESEINFKSYLNEEIIQHASLKNCKNIAPPKMNNKSNFCNRDLNKE